MKDQRKSNVRTAVGKKSDRKWLYWGAALLSVVIVVGAVLGISALHDVLFCDNPRLILRRVRIDSSGYWQGREDDLCRLLDLNTGVNLYRIDRRKLRERLERIPGIKTVAIQTVLPDTLNIHIEERIPRAALGNGRQSLYVVDEEAVVIPRRQSLAVTMELPGVYGLNSGLKTGEPNPQLVPAMRLLMAAVRGFPDVRIAFIYVHRGGKKMTVGLKYHGDTLYQVIYPVENRGDTFMLSALQSAIIGMRQAGIGGSHLDMSFDGQVVVRK